jgi:transposase
MKRITVENEQSIFQSTLEKFQRRIVSAVEHKRMTIPEVKKRFRIKDDKTILQWMKKYGIFNPEYTIIHTMKNVGEPSNVKRLKDQLKAKEEENDRMRKEIFLLKQKGIMFDAIVQVVKEDYNIDLLKKVMPGQSTPISPKEDKEV